MAYCSNCGRRIYADDNYCSGCGRPVSQVATGSLTSPGTSFTPAVTEGRRPKSASVVSPSGSEGSSSMQQSNAAASTVKLVRIIFITVFLILLCAGAVAFFDMVRYML